MITPHTEVIKDLTTLVPLPKKYRNNQTTITVFTDQYMEGCILAAHPDYPPLKLNSLTNTWEKITKKRRKKCKTKSM